tara:strand:- start:728 stop:889 length:162 start_codon:yes stop_codon:yes gene_type:complete
MKTLKIRTVFGGTVLIHSHIMDRYNRGSTQMLRTTAGTIYHPENLILEGVKTQ